MLLTEKRMPERRKATVAAVVLCVSVLLTYMHDILTSFRPYTHLYKTHPWYLVESIDKFLVLLVCFSTLRGLYGSGIKGASTELRLTRASFRGIGTVVLCTVPMLVGFALTQRISPQLSLPGLAFKGLLSPFAEEVHARGFAFLQLYRRAGWPFWAAVLPQALLSGFGHVEQGQTTRDQLGIFVLIFTGALIFAWTLQVWDSLWVPLALHACMNIWWDLFSISRNILGGWLPFALQQLTMVLVVCATYRRFTEDRRCAEIEP
jgi:membrane protease YdiL (CAAX protease family)